MEIISTINVETQEQLLQELQAAGFRSTQATISRDIKELRIVKELSALGTYRYTVAAKEMPTTFSSRINTIFRECVTRYDYAQNIVVIHTLPGLAGAAASAIDAMSMSDVICVIEDVNIANNYERWKLNLESMQAELEKLIASQELEFALLEAQVRNNDVETLLAESDSLQMLYLNPSERRIKELQAERARIERAQLLKNVS